MYKIIVGEAAVFAGLGGRTLTAQPCRISALSSADYCLRSRVDEAWGRVAWRGNKKEIRRLFEAELLDASGLEKLKEGRDYTVRFLNACCA